MPVVGCLGWKFNGSNMIPTMVCFFKEGLTKRKNPQKQQGGLNHDLVNGELGIRPAINGIGIGGG